MKLTLKEIADNIGGELIGADVQINSISRDSRDIGDNCLYVPLKGEKFDGHDFIEMACAEGAVAVVTERGNEVYILADGRHFEAADPAGLEELLELFRSCF